jgi:penicillin-binding protein 2
MIGEEEIVRSHEARSNFLTMFVLAVFGILLARLWYLQVFRGELFLQYSLENRLREEIVRSPRGMIFSRNNDLLVDNKPRFDAVLTPQYLLNHEQTLTKLANILDMSMDSIKKIISKNSFQAKYRPIIIKKNISIEEISKIETDNDDLPGISVETFISREYTDSEIGAHLLGFISEISQDQLPDYRQRDGYNYRLGDFIGQFGLEQRFDRLLRGVNGLEYVEVDALGRKKKYINTDNLFKGIEDVPYTPGRNVKLTIDREMQLTAHEFLKDKAGSLVAMDVQTGEMLAMVSTPGFRPSEFSRGVSSEYWNELNTNPRRPLRDRSIQDHYSPGSTFKVFTAITALAKKTITEHTEVSCNGGLKFGNKVYHCWKKYGHGSVSLIKAIRESCNVYFQKAAMNLNIDDIAKYSMMFGLGTKTGIDLPREIAGLIPTEEWKVQRNGKPWQKGETLSCAIGQSYVLTTPLQLAVAYGAIANGGNVLRPQIILEVSETNGKITKTLRPEIVKKADVSPEILSKIRKGLFEVTHNPKGTAYWFRGKGTMIAGKTGTSQVRGAKASEVYKKCEDMPYDHRHHGVFAAFLPYENPKIAIAALVEHGCHGSTAAAPVVNKVAEIYMQKYQPELYAQYLEMEKGAPKGAKKEREAAPSEEIVVPTEDGE